MLRRAVRYAIEQKVNIILFSASFEGGGNGDGRGPINKVVSEAISAGIIWINASGNYGRRVYNGPVRIEPDGYLRFRNGADGTALRFRNRADENSIAVTLTWNDYREQEDAGTSKDLDLYVENWAGKILGSSEKKQITGEHAAEPEQSRNPREKVVLNDLAANAERSYRIRVRKRSGDFTANDRIRVLITSSREDVATPAKDAPDDAITFLDATGREEMYPPADHPLVLTVGDSSPESAIGPTADYRLKPDVILEDSRAYFTDGQVTAGSSNAAAYFAGVVAVLKAAEPKLQSRHLFRLARQNPAPKTTVASTSSKTARVPELLPRPAARLQLNSSRGLIDLQLGRTSLYPPMTQATAKRETTAATAPATPLGALRATRPEIPATFDRRVWRTPSRARLMDGIQAQ
jgi:hypothetical protein